MGEDWWRGVPWHIVILFGGGFALAQGFRSSGLSEYLGTRLDFLGDLPPYLMILAICLFMTFLTELTSNTATTTALLPILGATALAAGQAPLLYMLPATIAASCAFMLPVATPPNAIVFGSGKVTLPQMARAGVLINLASAPVIAALVYWLGPLVFGE
jgi:sodium-dependent dicarboxylate transporter 2/3/5